MTRGFAGAAKRTDSRGLWQASDAFAQFSPADIPDVFAWYRGDSVDESGGDVDVWFDRTGNGRSTMPLPGTEPAWVASNPDFNGQPTLSFNGVDQQLASDANAFDDWGDEVTLFYVARAASPATIVNIFTHGGGVNGTQASTQFLMRPRNTTPAAGFSNTTPIGFTTDTLAYAARLSSDELTAWVNGSIRSTNAITSVTSVAPGSVAYIGNNPFSSWTFFPGDIAEVICVARAMTDAEMAQTYAYIAARYDLAIDAVLLEDGGLLLAENDDIIVKE